MHLVQNPVAWFLRSLLRRPPIDSFVRLHFLAAPWRKLSTLKPVIHCLLRAICHLVTSRIALHCAASNHHQGFLICASQSCTHTNNCRRLGPGLHAARRSVEDVVGCLASSSSSAHRFVLASYTFAIQPPVRAPGIVQCASGKHCFSILETSSLSQD